MESEPLNCNLKSGLDRLLPETDDDCTRSNTILPWTLCSLFDQLRIFMDKYTEQHELESQGRRRTRGAASNEHLAIQACREVIEIEIKRAY